VLSGAESSTINLLGTMPSGVAASFLMLESGNLDASVVFDHTSETSRNKTLDLISAPRASTLYFHLVFEALYSQRTTDSEDNIQLEVYHMGVGVELSWEQVSRLRQVRGYYWPEYDTFVLCIRYQPVCIGEVSAEGWCGLFLYSRKGSTDPQANNRRNIYQAATLRAVDRYLLTHHEYPVRIRAQRIAINQAT
jgi:hypothetical protein